MQTTKTIRSKRKNGTIRVQIQLDRTSKVEQHHKNKVDINTIIKRYHKSGLIPQRKVEPTYGDFTGVTDYHEAQNKILQADTDFMLLPSEIRNRFKNSVGLLLAFLNDRDNLLEAQEMGLIPKPAAKDTDVPEQSTTEEAEPLLVDVTKDVVETVEPAGSSEK